MATGKAGGRGRHRARRSKSPRRSQSFGVRQWLQVGAASAGVSAALFGVSLAGPQVSVALADDSGQASQESSSGSDGSGGSESGGPSADGARSHTSPAASPSSSAASEGQATVESPSSSSSSDEKSSASSASTGSKSDADDKTAVTAQTNTGSLQSGSTQADDQTSGSSAKHSGVPASSESSSSSSSEGPSSESASISTLASSSAPSSVADRASSSAAVVNTPAAALMSAPAVTETVAAVTDSGPSVAASNPVIPWALQVAAPDKHVLGDQISGFFGALQAFVAQLPLADPFKDLLNGAAFAVRQTLLNQTPTVAPILLTGLSNTLITGHVDAVDPEGDQIVYRLVQGPASGTVQLNSDGSFAYTPGAGFTGVDSFVVMAQDLGLHVNLLDLFRGAGTA
ncbi:MAG: hypothetical protein QOI43_2924, partial [Gaiellales bacterium]|nr:hypothetical protein [Gaiellales bacterium]